MKVTLRSVKDVLIGIGEIILFPFLFIFLILFGIIFNVLFLCYEIRLKFQKDAPLPRIFDIIFDSFDNIYFE